MSTTGRYESALEKLNNSRNLTQTRLLCFPEWFVKDEWEVYEYLNGGSMCTEKGLRIDFFEAISFVNYERCPIKNEWFIQAITNSKKGTKIITLKRKKP